MIFCIQASNPKALNQPNKTDDTLSSAIETAFPMMTEDAIMMWNNIPIPLSYKYDIAYMIEDIIDLLKALRKAKTGTLKISWLPDTFRSDWIIKWDYEKIIIETFWDNTVGNLTKLLNKIPKVSLNKCDFINEWKQLLATLINGLKKCNYNETNLPEIAQLIYEYERIDGTGILYKE